jgi:UDPglucose 6-dehydrogenase
LERTVKESGCDFNGLKVAILGLAFKQETNDTRNSPSYDIVEFLGKFKPKEVILYDKIAEGMFKRNVKSELNLTYADSLEKGLEGVNAVFISTDWQEFRNIADILIKNKIEYLFDGRRILANDYEKLKNAGVKIIAVGS